MATLTRFDKVHLEDFLEMHHGYVLHFSDRTFAEFFMEYEIDIDDEKYWVNKNSGSKANRMREFWKIESNEKVGEVLNGLIQEVEFRASRGGVIGSALETELSKCRAIARRLQGEEADNAQDLSGQLFSNDDLSEVLEHLPIHADMKNVLEARLKEIQVCIDSGAPLAAIFLCGSVAEGVLPGLARENSSDFTRATKAPKLRSTGSAHRDPFGMWSLSQLIDVSHELGFIDEGLMKFTDTLRDFRNYIHPNKAIESGFEPNIETANICAFVVRTVISSFGNRDKS